MGRNRIYEARKRGKWRGGREGDGNFHGFDAGLYTCVDGDELVIRGVMVSMITVWGNIVFRRYLVILELLWFRINLNV